MPATDTTKSNLFSLGVITAGGLKFILLVVALFTGFEITDEGATLLSLTAPVNMYDELHLQFRFLWYPVLKFVPITIFNVRLITLISEILSIVWLSWWLAKLSACIFNEAEVKISFITIFFAGLIGLHIGVNSYSGFYMHITNNLACLLAGCLFGVVYFSILNKAQGLIYLLLALAGSITGVQLVVKFSTSLLELIVVLGFIVFMIRRYKFYSTLAYLVGIVLFLILFFLSVKSPADLVQTFNHGKEMIDLQGYDMKDILIGNVIYDGWCYAVYALSFLIPFVLLIMFSKVSKQTSALLALLVQLIFILLDSRYNLLGFKPGWYLRTVHPLISLSAAMLYINYAEWFKGTWSRERFFVFTLLIILPAVAAMGTAIPLQMALSSYIVPLSIAFFCLLVITINGLTKYIVLAGSTFLLLIQFYYLAFSMQRLPNGYAGNIKKQDTYLSQEGVFVSKQAADFLFSAERTLQLSGYQPGTEIVALTNMPGVVYYLKGSSPSTHWYFSDETTRIPGAGIKLNCYHLGRLSAAKSRYLLILEQTDPGILACLPVALNKCKLLATLYNPYFKRNMNIYFQPAYAQ